MPPVLLAEAQLMAVTHAAMFSLAAIRHFKGRDTGERTLPGYPALPLGPDGSHVTLDVDVAGHWSSVVVDDGTD